MTEPIDAFLFPPNQEAQMDKATNRGFFQNTKGHRRCVSSLNPKFTIRKGEHLWLAICRLIQRALPISPERRGRSLRFRRKEPPEPLKSPAASMRERTSP